MNRVSNLPYTLLYGTLIATLLLVILAAFTLTGLMAWTIGLLYILYDSLLFVVIVSTASRALNRPRRAASAGPAARRPTMAVIVPARNEKSVLPACLDALFAQTDLPDEIVVVDDGSTDGTLSWLCDQFQIVLDQDRGCSAVRAGFWVLRKAHGGKAEALNAGWRASSSDIVVTLDADTVPDPSALAAVRRAFAENSDLAAAGGVLTPRAAAGHGWPSAARDMDVNRAAAGPRTGRVFEFYQKFEYVRSFLERLAWMNFGTLVLVSGAFSGFRREVLQRLGGFNPESRVEDYELIYRLYRHSFDNGIPAKVEVLADAHAVTDAPPDARRFLQQRSRWFAGFLDTLFQNRDMIGNRCYGRLGLMMLPLKLVDTLKPIYGLLALIIFIAFIATGYRPYVAILYVLAAKAVFDLVYHCRGFALYHRWLGIPLSPRRWAASIWAALTEPFAFQILRQIGAVMGWAGYLRGRINWAPQRVLKNASLPARLLVAAAILYPVAVMGGETEDAFQRGMELKRQEKFSEAADIFAGIVSENPAHADALQQLATIQGWLGRHDESIRTWNKATALHPDNVEYRVGLARIFTWKNELSLAEREYRQALKIDPRDFDALMGLGDVEFRQDEILAARVHYLQAQAQRPNDPDVKKKIAAAVLPTLWRLDMGYLYDGYSSGRGEEHNTLLQIGYRFARWRQKAVVWFRHEWQHHFEKTDNPLFFGGSIWPSKHFAAQLEIGVTPQNDFFSDWQTNLLIDFPLNKYIVPSLNFRHYDYPTGSVQVYAGSLRVQPKPWVAVSSQFSVSNNITGPSTSAWQTRTEWFWGETLSAYAGYSRGDESLPPQSTAFNESIFLGAIWQINRQWALRLDYSHERRPNFYFRNSAGTGLTFKF